MSARPAAIRPLAPCPAPLTAPAAVLAGLLVLAGCGGGGSDSPAPPPVAGLPTPTPSPVPSPTPAPPPPTPGTRLTCSIPNFQADMLEAVNARRAAGASCGAQGQFPPVAALTWNAALAQSAAGHSDDMVARNFFSHTGSNGSNVGDRATAAGYNWRTVGENIAAGQSSIAQVMDGWMKSDGHCANLMNAQYRDIGVACVSGNANTSYRTYWTQNFGAAR
ncbi:CAP domain-containing protein [Roseateles asaccharophilus]|uniref:Uncharacterized protein YkwD n=1 Tax=Roseateles asaccharophilus TaxID=582607 RepID=A0ABU2A4N7_9BURK|nr:CAP domain-containing protein [Roseateles asaccharophilus]MDR7331588.1 uncharacterized protein YkwD [Roseateles asaccharophilus]